MIIEMNPKGEDFDDEPDDDVNNESCPESDLESDTEDQPGECLEPDSISEVGYVPRGGELKAELSRIWTAASELEGMGFFFDPKDLYSNNRKQQLQAMLSADLDKLQRYKVKLDSESVRCKKNLDRIQSDAEKLNLDQVRECYLEAGGQQQKQYNEAISDRHIVLQTLMKVQTAVGSAQISGFPAGETFSPLIPNQPLPGYQSDPGCLDNGVDDLTSLGPLGKNQEQTDSQDT